MIQGLYEIVKSQMKQRDFTFDTYCSRFTALPTHPQPPDKSGQALSRGDFFLLICGLNKLHVPE